MSVNVYSIAEKEDDEDGDGDDNIVTIDELTDLLEDDNNDDDDDVPPPRRRRSCFINDEAGISGSESDDDADDADDAFLADLIDDNVEIEEESQAFYQEVNNLLDNQETTNPITIPLSPPLPLQNRKRVSYFLFA